MNMSLRNTPTNEKFRVELLTMNEFDKQFNYNNTDFAPENFQRMFRTNLKLQKQIIKSVLEGEMSASFHLREMKLVKNGIEYQCLDGLQRSTVVKMFLNNLFKCPPITIYYNGKRFQTTKDMLFEDMKNMPGAELLLEVMSKVKSLIVVIYNKNMTDSEAINKFQHLNSNVALSKAEGRDGFNSYIAKWIRHKATWGNEFGGRLKLFNYDITPDKVFRFDPQKGADEGKFELLETRMVGNVKRPIHALKADRRKNIQDFLAEFVLCEFNYQEPSGNAFKGGISNKNINVIFDLYDFRYENDGIENPKAEENGKPITDMVELRCDWVYDFIHDTAFDPYISDINLVTLRMIYFLTYGIEMVYNAKLKDIIIDRNKLATAFCRFHFKQLAENRKKPKNQKSEYAFLINRASMEECKRKLDILMTEMNIKTPTKGNGIIVKDKIRSFNAMNVSVRYDEVGKKCEYCKKSISRIDVQADHAIPHSKGGQTIDENLRISCSDCNNAKGSMTEDEFRMIMNQRENDKVMMKA